MKEILYEKRNFILIYAIVSILLVFTIGHYDANAIVGWAVELLRTISHGDLYNYQNNLQEINLPTNYGIVINAIDAVILLPIYIVELCKISVPLIVYISWYKIILSLALVNTCLILAKTMRACGFENNRIEIFIGLSFLTLVYGVAMGQVDLLALLFMTLGLYYGVNKSYYRMSIVFSIAFMIKAFPIMAIAPIFVYLFKKQFLNNDKTKWICETVLFIGPIILERVIEIIFIDDFLTYSTLVNEYNFIPKLQAVNICGISVYILLTFVTLLVYFIVVLISKDLTMRALLLCIDLLYFYFYLLIDYSPQYLIYGFVFMMVTVCALEDRAILYYLLINIGVIAISLGHFNESTLNALLISNSLIGDICHVREFYVGAYIPVILKEGLWLAGRVIVSGLSAWLIIKLLKRKER